MHSSPFRCVALVVSVLLLFGAAAQAQEVPRAPSRMLSQLSRSPKLPAKAVAAADPAAGGYTYNVLYSFCLAGGVCTDGVGPEASLIQDAEGNLYGTTTAGGGATYNLGSVFKLDTTGHETVLYGFCPTSTCPDGKTPLAGLVQDGEGNFYGTTEYGGTNGEGTIFEVYATGGEAVLYSFCPVTGCVDGENPLGGLVRDSGGNLYGTTSAGGAHGDGAVFKLDSLGSYSVLYSFCSEPSGGQCLDGAGPQAGLVQDATGNLYGTTNRGGNGGGGVDGGVIFEVDTSNHETVLYNFCTANGCTDGYDSYAGLYRDSMGNLYGTTFQGGTGQYANSSYSLFGGTVFKLDTLGNYTVLYNFCSVGPYCTDGSGPMAGLLQDTAGNLYGTTPAGGANYEGVVFKVDTSNNETVLYPFCSVSGCADGAQPQAGLLQDSAGNLYGTTYLGGFSQYLGGVVFELAAPAAKITPTVTVTPAATTITTAQSLEVTITVSGGSGNPTPTGTVTLSSGSYNSGATALVAGSVMITIPAGALAVGLDTLSGSYSGDSNYNGAIATSPVNVSLPPPPPTISSLSPFVATAGGTAFTLTVNGTNFASGAVVNWGSTGLTTHFVNSTQLTAPVSAPLIAAAGSVEVTVTLGGETSAPALFTITPNGTFPLVVALSPSSATEGGPSFTLTVTGANFDPATELMFDGFERPVKSESPTQLTATILASDISTAGTDLVTVVNPGVGTSAAQLFAVLAVTPVLGSVSLADTADLSGDRLLTLTGTNFTPTSSVEWGTTTLAATYLDPWTITAVVTASEHAALPATVTVTNGSSDSNGIVVQ